MTSHAIAAALGAAAAATGLLAGGAGWSSRPAPAVGIVGAPAIYFPKLAAAPDACRPGRPCLIIRRR